VIDMADTATETQDKTKKDEMTGDDLVWDPKQQDYVSKTMSPALYRQQKAAQNRQAMAAAGLGLGAQAAQFAIGSTIFGDPAVEGQGQEKARLAAELRKGPDYQTETEKQARREAALAPVERKAEAVQRRAEAIAASTGDVSVRSLLAAGEAGIAQMRQAALDVEADIATEDVRRQQIKADRDIQTRKSIEEIDAMMLELRNKYIRQPLHKFISDAGKLAGTVMAYAPGKVIDDQVDRLRAAGMEDEREIARFIRTFEGRPRAARKAADELIAKRAPNVVEPTGDTGKTAEEQKYEEGEFERKAGEQLEAALRQQFPETGDDDRIGLGNPTARAVAQYEKLDLIAPDKYDHLYKKGRYAYGFKDGVWTVYLGNRPNIPFTKNGKKFQFSMDEAKNSTNPNVRELYDLAISEELTNYATSGSTA